MSETNVSVGDFITIQCVATHGRPTPALTRYHNKNMTDVTDTFYLQNEVKLTDAGSYKCSGKNNAGRSESSVVNIVVHGNQGGKIVLKLVLVAIVLIFLLK